MMSCNSAGRIVVTGVTGFVGQALAENLAEAGYWVIGISDRAYVPERLSRFLGAYHCADLTMQWPEVGPFSGLVHLAGLAATGPSFDRPQEYLQTNSSMVTHMFEDALRRQWRGRAIVVSSGAVYGGESGTPLDEHAPLIASSPYVVSKLLVERQAEYYRRRGLNVMVVRPFNHVGPGQARGFIVPDLAARLATSDSGATLTTGNLDSARDYTDVRDVVRAYRMLLETPEPRHTTYNVCSGVSRTGWDVLAAVCRALSRPTPQTATSCSRAIDPPVIAGDSGRLRSDTGWRPVIPFQQSVDAFVALAEIGERGNP